MSFTIFKKRAIAFCGGCGVDGVVSPFPAQPEF